MAFDPQIDLFDKYANAITNFVQDEDISCTDKGKATAKTIELLQNCLNIDRKQLDKKKRKILTQYAVRQTRGREIRKKNDYLKGFVAKGSLGEQLALKLGQGKMPSLQELKSFVLAVYANEKLESEKQNKDFDWGLNMRDALRESNCLLKFLTENYKVFHDYINAGTVLVNE